MDLFDILIISQFFLFETESSKSCLGRTISIKNYSPLNVKFKGPPEKDKKMVNFSFLPVSISEMSSGFSVKFQLFFLSNI